MLKKNRVRRAALPFLGCALGFLIMGLYTMIQQNMRAGAGWFEFLSGIGLVLVGIITATACANDNVKDANRMWAKWKTWEYACFFLTWFFTILCGVYGMVATAEGKSPSETVSGTFFALLAFTILWPLYKVFIPLAIKRDPDKINLVFTMIAWGSILVGALQHRESGGVSTLGVALIQSGWLLYLSGEIINSILADKLWISSWEPIHKTAIAFWLWAGYVLICFAFGLLPLVNSWIDALAYVALLFAGSLVLALLIDKFPKEPQKAQ